MGVVGKEGGRDDVTFLNCRKKKNTPTWKGDGGAKKLQRPPFFVSFVDSLVWTLKKAFLLGANCAKSQKEKEKKGEHEGISHSAVAPVFSALIFTKLQGFFVVVVIVVVVDKKYQSFMRPFKASNTASTCLAFRSLWHMAKGNKRLRGWSDCSQNLVKMENSFRRKASDWVSNISHS